MRILFLFCLMTAFRSVQAQDFPASFVGHWEGTLQWHQAGKTTPQSVRMQLLIAPADTPGHYTWQLIYGDKSEDNRPYRLKPVDTAKGHWVIDEGNGIRIDQYWLGNRFTSAFTVQTATILDTYWIEDGKLVAEFYSYRAAPVSTTGQGTEDSPKVDSYAVRSYQKAILVKKQ